MRYDNASSGVCLAHVTREFYRRGATTVTTSQGKTPPGRMRVWFRWDPRVCCVNSQGDCVSMCGLMRPVDGARLATLHNTHEPACARKQFEKIRPATRIVALSGQIASGRLE
jgi:hypothetical protein